MAGVAPPAETPVAVGVELAGRRACPALDAVLDVGWVVVVGVFPVAGISMEAGESPVIAVAVVL